MLIHWLPHKFIKGEKNNMDNMESSSWFMPINAYERLSNRESRGETGKKRFNVHLCPECNRVFEDDYEMGSTRRLHIYKDFPTYGLNRANCPTCSNASK